MSKEAYNKIISKFLRLDEYLRYLQEIQKVNKKTFTNDFHFFGLAERYLQLAIEVVMDIGKLLLVTEDLPRAENNSEIFGILVENKVLPKSLLKRLDGITSFRNILVHDYEKIDREIVYGKLQNNLKDFIDFKKMVLKKLN